jgi:hypothetical protein
MTNAEAQARYKQRHPDRVAAMAQRFNTPEYISYRNAKARCRDLHNPYHGGRGIKFLFVSFEQFYAELGPRPEGKTLDRINNDGNYEPGNVRWATKSEQAKNRRGNVEAAQRARLAKESN